MPNPFEVLGLTPAADTDQVHTAYRKLVKACHPDQFPDEAEKAQAQEKLLRINLAYEQALKLARKPLQQPVYAQSLPVEDSLKIAMKMLQQHRPESAIRQLQRAETKNDLWYSLRGQALMQLERFEDAEKSFREAIRRCPGSNEYHRLALEAQLAARKAATLGGRLRSLLKRK